MVQFSFPPQRAYVLDDEQCLRYKWAEFKEMRSQDLEKMYYDAGQFYCYDVKKYLLNKGVKGKILPIFCPEHEAQDIDTEEDWRMAEIKVEYLRRSENCE